MSFARLLLGLSLFSSFTSMSFAQSPTVGTAIATASSPSSSLAAPTCADACIQKATSSQSCAPSDHACLCSQSTQIQEMITQCIGTSTCSDSDKGSAIDYFPEYCASQNVAVESSVPTVIATAGGSAPTKPSTIIASSLATRPSTTQTTTVTPDAQKTNDGLALPAILGIALVAILVVVGVAALLVWSFIRRKYARRGPRKDLGDELITAQPRPARSASVHSDFIVQPSPVEKDEFGPTLSRSSTLVPPPPIAKDDLRSSVEKRNSARNKTLNLLLGTDLLRGSFLSSRSSTKKSSLMVPPLNIRKSQEDELRMSKF